MDSLTDDLWTSILVRLPLKSIATSKLVCKRWKSILESPFLRNLFLSRHQNSHSMWSLIRKDHQQEAVAHYGCEIWGQHPPRQLGSYISTFITEAFLNHKEKYRQAKVVAYTDVGLILIRVISVTGNVLFYVANPVSRECVETDPPWFGAEEYSKNLGLATRTDKNGVVLGYKVVLLNDAKPWTVSFNLLIYSSETGLWRQETVQFRYYFRLHHQQFSYSVSINGNIHWVARHKLRDEAVISIDLYGSDHPICRVTRFPDLQTRPKFQRSCTVSQGSLMYMNVFPQGYEHCKLSVWRLKSSWEWQLVSEISYIGYVYPYFPLAINPFDAETVYFWSNDLEFVHQCLVSLNLRNGEFVVHDELERRNSGGCILKSRKGKGKPFTQLAQEFSLFVLPKWLYRIPNTVTNPTFISWRPKTSQPNKDPVLTREQDKLNNTWQSIKQKKSVKGDSSSSTAHHIVATGNRFSMLEED